MNTPSFQQLTGLLAVLKAGLRADELLVTGSGEFDLEYEARQVCHTTAECQLVDVTTRGAVKLAPDLIGLTKLPALAIWVREGESMDIRGARSGTTYPGSISCDLGLQYLFLTRAQDKSGSPFEFSTRFGMTIYWKICEIILTNFRATNSSLRNTYNIDEMGLGAYRPLPLLPDNITGIEADLSMEFKRPPWMSGADSVLVTDLDQILTDHNEKGDYGADPLIQSKYTTS